MDSDGHGRAAGSRSVSPGEEGWQVPTEGRAQQAHSQRVASPRPPLRPLCETPSSTTPLKEWAPGIVPGKKTEQRQLMELFPTAHRTKRDDAYGRQTCVCVLTFKKVHATVSSAWPPSHLARTASDGDAAE